MRIISAKQACINLDQLIDELVKSPHPIVISGQNNNAVLISEENWLATQKALHLQERLVKFDASKHGGELMADGLIGVENLNTLSSG
jgi:antitoxin YefM